MGDSVAIELYVPSCITASSTDNGQFFLSLVGRFYRVPSFEEEFKEIAQQLEGDVFEGKSRPVKELE
jgi:hypothetical protein